MSKTKKTDGTKKAKDDNSGHRKRLKHRYKTQGADEMDEGRLLELLLTYAVPRKDQYPQAKELLSKFGDLENVLSASMNDLCTVEGIGENTAILISLVNALYRKSKIIKNKRKIHKTKAETAENFCTFFTDVREERIAIALYNGAHQLLTCEWISSGYPSECALDIRKLMQLLSRDNVAYVAFAHNHPNGDLKPSVTDIGSMYMLKQKVSDISVEMIDMFIICEDKYLPLGEYINVSDPFSFREDLPEL